VPELPDLTVVADALHSALAGRRIRSATAPGPLAVRGTPSELEALVSQRVESIRRRGKFLLIRLEHDEIAANPMLTGRFQLAEPGDRAAWVRDQGDLSEQWFPPTRELLDDVAALAAAHLESFLAEIEEVRSLILATEERLSAQSSSAR